MRNLLIFISKYNAFFLFVIFEVSSLVILVKYNSFQKSTYISSSNQITGAIYTKMSEINGYLSLGTVNDSLARENSRLRNLLKSSFYLDTLAKQTVNDSIYKQQYTYVVAKVIANSINRRNNYLTINRGSKDGITKDMGVICSSGVVGIVLNVTPHMANVQSILHKDTRISGMLADTKGVGIGSFTWVDNLDPGKGLLTDVPNHVSPKIGEQVITSGISTFFPMGVPIGRVSKLNAKGGYFLNMELNLAVDYSKLEYVYVVTNYLAKEQVEVEAQRKKDD